MSRIGNQIIAIPQGVTVTPSAGLVTITGPKGTLEVVLHPGIAINVVDSVITVTRESDTKQQKAFHGLVRSLIANAIIGVSEGFSKKLELHGVGFRATLQGTSLTLNLGFSHPVSVTPPTGIEFKVEKNTITISGFDKQLVGQVAANIRSIRKPEPYKGKGVRYSDEQVKRKPGKAAKAAGAA